jgi:peptidyl-prolyl cis-trans isomerase A (cyclophilin A)
MARSKRQGPTGGAEFDFEESVMKTKVQWAAPVLTLMFLSIVAATGDEPKAEGKKAPEQFRVKFECSCGDFVVEVNREWAPNGVDRFHDLVQQGFYDECRFFRVVPGFVVQFGMNGDPAVYAKWKDSVIKDDKVTQSNKRGYMTFASRGPDTRTSQVFINFDDNERLDALGFAPFGKVVEGMDVVDKINAQYGQKPEQGLIEEKGNEYLKSAFPKMDFVKKATVLKAEPSDKAK